MLTSCCSGFYMRLLTNDLQELGRHLTGADTNKLPGGNVDIRLYIDAAKRVGGKHHANEPSTFNQTFPKSVKV